MGGWSACHPNPTVHFYSNILDEEVDYKVGICDAFFLLRLVIGYYR